jgi:hypothetical protein
MAFNDASSEIRCSQVSIRTNVPPLSEPTPVVRKRFPMRSARSTSGRRRAPPDDRSLWSECEIDGSKSYDPKGNRSTTDGVTRAVAPAGPAQALWLVSKPRKAAHDPSSGSRRSSLQRSRDHQVNVSRGRFETRLRRKTRRGVTCRDRHAVQWVSVMLFFPRRCLRE